MSGVKRLAVGGPEHGQVIEPSSDAYNTIPLADGLHYKRASMLIPTVVGAPIPLPLLVPVDSDEVIWPVEVLDALICAVWTREEIGAWALVERTTPSGGLVL